MMKNLFCLIGIISCIVVVLMLGMLLIQIIIDKINQYQYYKRIKNRFDNTPTAACYCVDCDKWDSATGICYDPCNSRIMADCWFCYFAEPLPKEKNQDTRGE
ncbi:hypothetical protein KSU88_01495 [[Clostridium] innocuum]|uniref:hypothetical protein n=1 Tax=Clostridium innocuum TaxID=1522 RepID=UPI001C393B06|nr:hypothetical protein [[Clostridium] innocuum]MBV3115687.1 hypothetical protein [[Clostridium] innocuum]MCR0401141.1 hypothetical protein [[Clostridium] innocuum]